MENKTKDQSEKVLMSKCVCMDKMLEVNMDLVHKIKSHIANIDNFAPSDRGAPEKKEQPQTLVQHLNCIIDRLESNNALLEDCLVHFDKLI